MKAKEVLKLLKITRPTLCRYVKEGKINVKQCVNGQYIYNKDDVYNLLLKENDRQDVIYARVSSSNQKKDLENQLDTLRQFCLHNGIIISNEYSDICSGLNLDRKNFQSLLDDITEYKIRRVFITYKDRLTRLSYNMIENLFNKYGCEIIVLNEIDDNKQIEKELFEEIITLLHCFSMKMYSNRRKEKLNLIKKELELESNLENIE